jgi:transposase
MAKKHPRAYPLEFRAKIIELVRAGRGPEDLAAEFELSNQTIRNWIRQADLDAGKRTDGLTSEERTELFMLRKKVKQLTIEREILSKAAADSTGGCNISPMMKSGGVANGSAWAPWIVTAREGRSVEALEKRRIFKRHRSRAEERRWLNLRRSPIAWRDCAGLPAAIAQCATL